MLLEKNNVYPTLKRQAGNYYSTVLTDTIPIRSNLYYENNCSTISRVLYVADARCTLPDDLAKEFLCVVQVLALGGRLQLSLVTVIN